MDIDALADAWKAVARDRKAMPQLLAHYHRDIHFRDPLQERQGIDAFGHSTARFLKMARGLELDIDGGDSGLLVWRMAFSPPIGPSLQFDGTSHLRMADGAIRHQRDYWDLADTVAGSFPGGRTLWRRLVEPLV